MKPAIASTLISLLLLGCTMSTPAPVSSINKNYSSIERGSYRGNYYEVKKGDTLYFIAYVTDVDVTQLIHYNNLTAPYTIIPGQKIRLWTPAYKKPQHGSTSSPSLAASTTTVGKSASTNATSAANSRVSSNTPAKNSTADNNIPRSKKLTSTEKTGANQVDQAKSKGYVDPKRSKNVNNNVTKTPITNAKISKWLWPTKGRVVQRFSTGDQGNKGVDIAGQRGQSIVSSASGSVVYSGNALRGYGNLIIIKHNDNYLSAYAHNERLLVQEGQSVKAGQKIATMGSSGANSVKLHFEIRYQGKSVNPQHYLP
jgi:lipoprotein NlpD